MLGFEVKFKDKVLYLPLDAGFVITRKCTALGEEMYISIGLYDPSTNNIVKWLMENLHLNDEVDVTIKDIQTVSEPLEEYDFYKKMETTKTEADQKSLEYFLLLKEELKAEGVI